MTCDVSCPHPPGCKRRAGQAITLRRSSLGDRLDVLAKSARARDAALEVARREPAEQVGVETRAGPVDGLQLVEHLLRGVGRAVGAGVALVALLARGASLPRVARGASLPRVALDA